MIEIVLGIIGVIEAPLFFFFGAYYGRRHNKEVVKELKMQKIQNNELTGKVDHLNEYNETLSKKIESLEKHNNEQKEMLEKSYQAIGTLNQQNNELTTKIGNLENQLKIQTRTITPKKQDSELNKLLGELLIYGAKEWGKKKIDEWLYPDD